MMFGVLCSLLILAGCVQGGEVCYKAECYTDDPPWGGTLQRPLKYLPSSPETLNVRYFLLSPENPNDFQELNFADSSSISAQNFNTNRNIHIIIHGHGEHATDPWPVEMSKEIVKVESSYCIAVDWSVGAAAPYFQSTADIRVVGSEVALALNMLIGFGFSVSKIRIIGHSLGAHVAGEIGKRVRNIGVMFDIIISALLKSRIWSKDQNLLLTALQLVMRKGEGPENFIFLYLSNHNCLRDTNKCLDPAGPYFQGTPLEVRMDPSDAVFVAVIHTNACPLIPCGGLGIDQLIGHVDILPNGGKIMPGCSDLSSLNITDIDSVPKDLKELWKCSHTKSFKYYIESIRSPQGFISFHSSTYKAFQSGEGFPCPNGKCISMGHYTAPVPGIPSEYQTFYLNTGPEPLYSRYRYKLIMQMTGFVTLPASLKVSLSGDKGNTSPHEVCKAYLLSGSKCEGFIDVEIEVEHPTSVTFSWKKNLLDLTNSKLGVTSATVEYGKDGFIQKFCGSGTVSSEQPQILNPC